MIKCSCGSLDSKTNITLGSEGMFFNDKEGRETLMYLDANAKMSLIKEIRKFLIEESNAGCL